MNRGLNPRPSWAPRLIEEVLTAFCNSARRSANGSSGGRRISPPAQTSVMIVMNASRKKIRPVNINSELDVRHLADHQDADAFRDNRISQKFISHRILPEQMDIFRLQNPQPKRHNEWHPA